MVAAFAGWASSLTPCRVTGHFGRMQEAVGGSWWAGRHQQLQRMAGQGRVVMHWLSMYGGLRDASRTCALDEIAILTLEASPADRQARPTVCSWLPQCSRLPRTAWSHIFPHVDAAFLRAQSSSCLLLRFSRSAVHEGPPATEQRRRGSHPQATTTASVHNRRCPAISTTRSHDARQSPSRPAAILPARRGSDASLSTPRARHLPVCLPRSMLAMIKDMSRPGLRVPFSFVFRLWKVLLE